MFETLELNITNQLTVLCCEPAGYNRCCELPDDRRMNPSHVVATLGQPKRLLGRGWRGALDTPIRNPKCVDGYAEGTGRLATRRMSARIGTAKAAKSPLFAFKRIRVATAEAVRDPFGS